MPGGRKPFIHFTELKHKESFILKAVLGKPASCLGLGSHNEMESLGNKQNKDLDINRKQYNFSVVFQGWSPVTLQMPRFVHSALHLLSCSEEVMGLVWESNLLQDCNPEYPVPKVLMV